ncbi:uncharacterized protein LOC130678786 isoform X1 [Microplitis mediator]|uniref:uncharacterized protein LOC130678786 isoform X1 n=2 Tax=Microplitis mediator TaxID=375433 RepID=UPI0025575E98|nr:uncharacterized protein LOC130678786 isoform X1 [Microplitis mediator]XP_057342242.1 uncharacterized protein LOC130678786 isoform X1 [Microplitis mediator]
MDISSLLEVQVNEGQPSADLSSDPVDSKPKNFIQFRPSEIITPEESKFYRRMFGNDVAQVRFRRLHCSACDEHIGSAPCDSYNMQEHPMLKTLLCAACREFYGDGDFEQGEDATDMFCRWCANGGNLYCCSYCCNTFCDKCIKRNFDTEVRKRIEEDEKWKCFVCDPRDLYTLRGVCRALLLHVKTVTRILKSNPTMPQKDIDSKMELDDSKCCIGKRTTRRKRHVSSSDDDSLQGGPSKRSKVKNGSSKRRKSANKDHNYSSGGDNDKSMPFISNGAARFLPITPRHLVQESAPPGGMSAAQISDELPAPLLHFEQTMIEGDGQILANKPANPKIPEAILNNSAISLNPIPRNLFRGPPGNIINLRPIKLDSVPPGATLHRLARLPTRPNAPMVTIPGRGVPITSASVNQSPKTFLRCKNLSAIPTTTLTGAATPAPAAPSIIDIDSDPEELTVVPPNSSNSPQNSNNSPPNSNTSQQNNQTLKVINPVAVANLDASVMAADNPRRKIFEDVIHHPVKEVDKILTKIRSKLRVELKKAGANLMDNEAHNARVRLNAINRCVHEAVDELTAFNNTIIQQYRPWKESIITGDPIDSGGKIVLKKGERSSKYTSVDMECERDSESDGELDTSDDIDVDNLLDFTNKIRPFVEKDTINRSTNTEIETKSQGVQVYESFETKDYDRSIGYSLLMRTDYDNEKRKEVYKPTVIHDQHFGKYEEQFIFYLQHLEDRGDADSDQEAEGVMDKTSLTDVIDKDIERQEKMIVGDESEETAAKSSDVETSRVDVVELEEPVERKKKSVEVIDDTDAGVGAEKNMDISIEDIICHENIEEVNASDGVTKASEFGPEVTARLPVSSTPGFKTTKDCNGEELSSSGKKVTAGRDDDVQVSNDKLPEVSVADTLPAESLNDSRESNESIKLTASQEAKHEETVIAVKTLIEENSGVGRYVKWKNNTDDDDECMVLE